MEQSYLVSVVLLFTICIVNAEVRVSGIFTNSMVLQIPYPNKGVPPTNIFGTAFLNETVMITGSNGFPGPFKLKPNCTNGQPCEYGNWSVPIYPNTNDASFPGPYTISIVSMDGTTNGITNNVTFNDTYFGEVFLCSGQSNMAYQLYHCANFPQELNYSMSLSNIRMYQSNRIYSNYTLQNITTIPGWSNGASGWVVAGTGAGNHAAADFSCVCWESARIVTQWLMAEYPTKPKPYIGLIESDVGGTSVYYWAAGIAGRACNLTGELPSTGQAAGPNAPGALYNAMINPLCMNGKGISIRQAIYYQGEADSGENDDFSQNAYSCTLNGMIYSWRYCFNNTNLPFINVQLPNGKVFPYANDDTCLHGNYNGLEFSWPGIEVAQYKTYAMNDNTGIVTCEDQGQNTLHYSYKLEVSQRVALWMRYLTFNDMTMSRYHAIAGIDPRKKYGGNKLMADVDQPVPPKFVKAYRKASDVDPLTVYIEIENTGPNGMKLQPAVNCSAFDSKYGYVTICDYNCTIYYCCELGGANTLKFRMEGWYWHTHNGGGNNLGLMNWMPGNVTSIESNGVNNNSVIVARPILPPIGNINWPSGGDSVTKYEAIAVRQVELGTSNACVWANSYGIPISKGGPYDIDIQD